MEFMAFSLAFGTVYSTVSFLLRHCLFDTPGSGRPLYHLRTMCTLSGVLYQLFELATSAHLSTDSWIRNPGPHSLAEDRFLHTNVIQSMIAHDNSTINTTSPFPYITFHLRR